LGKGLGETAEQLVDARIGLLVGLKANSKHKLVEAVTEQRRTRLDRRRPFIIHCLRQGNTDSGVFRIWQRGSMASAQSASL